jgi:hypothetical protein
MVMKKVDLSDLKVGDKAWSCVEGEGIIQETDLSKPWTIRCHNQWYQTDGISGITDIHPTLFHSEQEFREYWGFGGFLEVFDSNTLTKREQFAMAAMQGLLSDKELSTEGAAVLAVKAADELITKLNEKQLKK